jgi:nicotinamidase-related amidase
MKYALLVVDMQQAVFEMKQPVHRPEELIRNLACAVRAAREKGIRVVFGQHENRTFLVRGTQGHRIIGEMDVRESDLIIGKKHPDIFESTGLDGVLKEEGIGGVIVGGLLSNGCVREACLSALKRGYAVCLLGDAHSTVYKNAERIIEDVNGEMEAAGVRLITVDRMPGNAATQSL